MMNENTAPAPLHEYLLKPVMRFHSACRAKQAIFDLLQVHFSGS